MKKTIYNELIVTIIYGSAREGRQCDAIVNWVRECLSRDSSLSLVTMDPRDFGGSGPQRLSERDIRRMIDASDAFLVVTPEYNHGYSGDLKRLIDAAQPEWGGKPVGFISYGGMAGGARAVEQLRQVFAELHTVTMRDVVSFANVWEIFDDREPLCDMTRYHRQLLRLMSYLRWWGGMLKDARKTQPYQRIAA